MKKKVIAILSCVFLITCFSYTQDLQSDLKTLKNYLETLKTLLDQLQPPLQAKPTPTPTPPAAPTPSPIPSSKQFVYQTLSDLSSDVKKLPYYQTTGPNFSSKIPKLSETEINMTIQEFKNTMKKNLQDKNPLAK